MMSYAWHQPVEYLLMIQKNTKAGGYGEQVGKLGKLVKQDCEGDRTFENAILPFAPL